MVVISMTAIGSAILSYTNTCARRASCSCSFDHSNYGKVIPATYVKLVTVAQRRGAATKRFDLESLIL
jgi:hypothetical protein